MPEGSMTDDEAVATFWHMLRTANAMGLICSVGVNPGGKWYAHCDDIEVEGGNPKDALGGVVDNLEKRLRTRIGNHDLALRDAKTKLANLVG